MLDVTPDSVIAVDGGGTKCRLALATPADTRIVEVGAANISTDFDAAVAEISLGLKRLAAETSTGDDQLKSLPAYLGIAGTTGPLLAGRLAQALPLDHTFIEDDRPAALIGALGERDGAIAHCGTGSFLAALANDTIRLGGGWGPVLGDEASAQWVGRKTLAATLNAFDHLAPRTSLVDEMLDHFGSCEAIVAFAARATPAEFGLLAQRTTRSAVDGDTVATTILSEAADYIARALPRLGWTPGKALCLTGGIGPEYSRYLPANLRSSLVDPAGSPLDGAIDLARKFHRDRAI
ncbi:MAG: BadF/BadG/BcrA/BcrD ATPase family protein [Boseongicola sp.]